MLWAILSLLMACLRQGLVEVGHDDEHYKFFQCLSRLTKISAIVLGMAINYEKEVLNMFMIYQLGLKCDELAVAKENYRRVERKYISIYKLEMYFVAFISASIVVLFFIPFGDKQ